MKWYFHEERGVFEKFENDPGEGWREATAAEYLEHKITEFKEAGAEEKRALEAQITELTARIAEFEEQRQAMIPPEPEDRSKEFSLLKCIRGHFHDDWRDAKHERELVEKWKADALERATTLSTTNDSYGGFLVPEEYLGSEFIELLYNMTAALRAGVREVPVTGGPVVIPTQEAGTTVYWVNENATITASDAQFGQKTAQPHAAAALVRMSNRVIRDSMPGVEAIVRNDIANAIAVELDRVIWKGSGASGQPLGIMNTTGTLDHATSAAITPDGLWDTIAKIEEQKVNVEAGLAIALGSRLWNELLQASDGAGTPKFSNDVAPRIQKTLASGAVPIFTTHNLSSTGSARESVTGVMRECLLLRWGGLQFAASEHASDGTNHAFVQNQTWIRAITDVDIIVRRPVAFCWNDNWT